MDVLKDKTIKSYAYTSRYSPFPFYYNENDKKYMYGITSQLSEDCSYTLHTVQPEDSFDSLALYYYGRPDLFWVIADFNRVQDSFKKLYLNYKTIKIPALSGIKFRM